MNEPQLIERTAPHRPERKHRKKQAAKGRSRQERIVLYAERVRLGLPVFDGE